MPNVSNEMPRHPFYLQRWFTEPASGSPHHHLVFDTAIDSPTVNGPSKHITRRMSEVPAIAYNAVYRSPPASGTQMCCSLVVVSKGLRLKDSHAVSPLALDVVPI